jgi:hypothetical protein
LEAKTGIFTLIGAKDILNAIALGRSGLRIVKMPAISYLCVFKRFVEEGEN